MPPLRARQNDVSLLAQYFVESFAKEFRKTVRGITPATETVLQAHAWPGNVRELRNLVERAMLLAEHDTLQPSDFESLERGRQSPSPAVGAFQLPAEGVNLEDVEKSLVIQALERSGGNQTRAATLLGLHRDQIRYRIEKFSLAKKETV